MASRIYNGRPPTSFIADADMRSLGYHNHQVFDVLNGSGDISAGYQPEQLAVDQVAGSGPFYDLYLIYSGILDAGIGVQSVQGGDQLLIAETDTPSNSVCWYRYTVTETLDTPVSSSGHFRVKYVTDTCSGFGDQSPELLCHQDTGYGGYGGTCNDSRVVVFREINTSIILSEV